MPSDYTQSQRPIAVTTPLGEDVLLLQSATVSERLSALFEIELELLSEDLQIDAALLLGQSATVRLELSEQKRRYFNGYISRFTFVGIDGRLARYRATLSPWLWFLTRSADCRIYQDQKATDIVKTVFRDAGFSDFEERLTGVYEPLEYCVQYRETHFNFIARLLEGDGIYWYFIHEDGKHTLVMADDYNSHSAFPGYERIAYRHDDDAVARDQDLICGWRLDLAVRSGAFAHDDFDFEKPSAELRTVAAISKKHPHSSYEIYDYPGDYVERNNGERVASVRLEELQVDQEVAEGLGYARGLAAGHLFTLADYPRNDQNREYLVISARHHLRTDDFQTSESIDGGFVCRSTFTAMNAKEPFRPARTTRKPIVRGPQTAIVVGQAGEDIWTDRYGRVKVQFHWDRYGNNDENSSCWIRVSQSWAGQNWGAIHVPRIGQEVIVDFLEGDPDRPIITGRVYNAEQMPPWALPDNKAQSGVMSRSTKNGVVDNANIIRMDDQKGSEELYVRAEKDMNTIVENNDTLKVGFEKKDGGNQTIDIYNNRAVTIEKGSDTLHLKQGSRTVTLDQGDHSLFLKQGNQVTQLDLGNCSLTLKTGNQVTKLDLGKSTTEAMQSIELKVGSSSLKIDQTGVTIKGMLIKIEGNVQTQIKGLMTQITGQALLKAQGGITMIN